METLGLTPCIYSKSRTYRSDIDSTENDSIASLMNKNNIEGDGPIDIVEIMRGNIDSSRKDPSISIVQSI